MKKINLTQAGGFPLEEKTLDNMQTAYFDVLKTIIGHFGLPSVGNFIIYGCEVVANTIQPGMMYIDGDLCFFAVSNGNLTTKIKKIESIEDAPFEGGNNLPTYFDYSALVNANGVLLSDFERLPKVNELVNQVINWADIQNIPNTFVQDANYTTTIQNIQDKLIELEKKNAVFTSGGGMVLWNKPANEIPAGWHEVADWKGRIPVGVDDRLNFIGQLENPEFATISAGELVPGRIGGNKNKTLNINEMPPHNHEMGGLRNYTGNNSPNTPGNYDQSSGGGLLYTYNNGGGQAFSILNPYRTVIFIEYTGV